MPDREVKMARSGAAGEEVVRGFVTELVGRVKERDAGDASCVSSCGVAVGGSMYGMFGCR